MSELWDYGAQPERTWLAWRRLGLVMLGTGLVVARLGFRDLGVWVFPGALATVACAVLLMALGHRRYAGFQSSLTATDALTSGGRLPLVVSVVTLGLALTGAAAVL